MQLNIENLINRLAHGEQANIEQTLTVLTWQYISTGHTEWQSLLEHAALAAVLTLFSMKRFQYTYSELYRSTIREIQLLKADTEQTMTNEDILEAFKTKNRNRHIAAYEALCKISLKNL